VQHCHDCALQAVRERYLAYIAGVVTEMKECKAIDVVSVMNEPSSPEWKNPSLMAGDLDQIQSVIEKAARIVREKAPGKTGCGPVHGRGQSVEPKSRTQV